MVKGRLLDSRTLWLLCCFVNTAFCIHNNKCAKFKLPSFRRRVWVWVKVEFRIRAKVTVCAEISVFFFCGQMSRAQFQAENYRSIIDSVILSFSFIEYRFVSTFSLWWWYYPTPSCGGIPRRPRTPRTFLINQKMLFHYRFPTLPNSKPVSTT